MSIPKEESTHTALQETKFIDLLRTRKLLEGYIQGCEKRVDWAGMDRNKIVRYAKQRLSNLAAIIESEGLNWL